MIQKLANKAGISYAKTVSILRQMSNMSNVQEKLKEMKQ